MWIYSVIKPEPLRSVAGQNFLPLSEKEEGFTILCINKLHLF